MPNLKDIKKRISAVSSNMKIVSAMKMVSASKFKKAVDRMNALKLYENRFNNIKNSFVESIDNDSPFLKALNSDSDKEHILFVPLASNRGLCGPFNANVFKRTLQLTKNEYKDCTHSFICLSKKVNDLLKRNSFTTVLRDDLVDKASYNDISLFAKQITDRFLKGEFQKVVFVYNSFKNAASQTVKQQVILPITIDQNNDSDSGSYFILEPTKKEILDYLIPKMISLSVYRIVLESLASEHGARMTAMHQASENAQELKKVLLLDYNKIRQASITNQIIEIVSGADAV